MHIDRDIGRRKMHNCMNVRIGTDNKCLKLSNTFVYLCFQRLIFQASFFKFSYACEYTCVCVTEYLSLLTIL